MLQIERGNDYGYSNGINLPNEVGYGIDANANFLIVIGNHKRLPSGWARSPVAFDFIV